MNYKMNTQTVHQ